MSQEWVIALAGAVIALLLGVIGWFINRSVTSIAEDVKETVKAVRDHATELALLKAEQASQGRELGLLRTLYVDLAGFLASQGFKRRDGA